MKNELKSCPFCGSEGNAIRIPGNFPEHYAVVCWNEECGASIGNYSMTKDEAVAAWNRRANDG